MTTTTWQTPHEIPEILLVFPADVLALMPPEAEIPEEFHTGTTKWDQLFADWFYTGLTSLRLTPKPGIDERLALRHLRAIIGSFQPKHEHKVSAFVYLCSLWFEDATWVAGKPA